MFSSYTAAFIIPDETRVFFSYTTACMIPYETSGLLLTARFSASSLLTMPSCIVRINGGTYLQSILHNKHLQKIGI